MSTSMDKIISLYVDERIDQIRKSSQSVSVKEATSAENVDISKDFLEVLNISFELKTQGATAILEKKDLIETTETKIELMFQSIMTSEIQKKDTKFDDIIALAITYFNMGMIYMNIEMQEFQLVISETHFTKCMTLLKDKELDRKTIITIIRVLNALHIISYTREEPECYSFLNTAMKLYLKYTKEEIEYPDPINFLAILGMDDEENSNSKIILENLKKKILQNMSNLYQKNYHNMHKFVTYVYYILDQLIEKILYLSSTYYVHWAITSSCLSQYFIHNYRFTEARNHLIAAEYMMKTFYQKEIERLNEKDDAELYKCLCRYNKTGYNSVIKSWGLYGAELLVASTNKLLYREEDNKSCETDNTKSESALNSKENFTNLLIFPGFEEDHKLLKDFNVQFQDKCVSNLNDAKTIFLNVLKCFNTVKEYFTIDEYLVDYVDIKLATSKVFKCLATFEQDKERQIKLYTRQTKIVKDVCYELEMIRCDRSNTPFLLEMMTKTSNELIIGLITGLNMKTHHLRLNVEQLNTEFTDEIKINIKQSIIAIISAYQFSIGSFDILKD